MSTTNILGDPRAGAMPVAWPAFALAVLWLAFAWPWLSGAVTIPWDGKAHFAPQVQFLAASLARGEWPWWAPDVFAGHPQIADPQSMIFSPPMVLLAALNPSPSLWAIDAMVLLTVLFAGLGVLVYGRVVGWHWAAALIAALVFMFGAAMAWRIQHFGQVMSLAYVPFALVCLRLTVRDGSYLAGLGAGLIGAAILLGRDQVGLLAIYTLAAYAVHVWLTAARSTATRLRALPPLILGALAGAAVIALPLWMTLLLAEQSNRPEIDFAGAAAGSLHPALLLTAFAANLYGSAGEMAAFWGPPSFSWQDTGLFLAQNMGVSYLSAFGLIALIYGLASGAALRNEARFWSAALGLMLVFALGGYTPAFQWIFDLLPGVDRFRRPADALFLVGAFAALVIGRVVTEALADIDARNEQSPSVMRATAATVAIVCVGLAVVLGVGFWRGHGAEAASQVAIHAVWFALAAAAAALAVWLAPIRPLVGAGALVALVAVDLRINNGPNGATALPTSAIDMLQPNDPHRTIRAIQARLAKTRTGDRRDRAELVGLGYHWPNAPLSHGLPVTLGANPVRLRWYVQATGAIDTIANVDQRTFSSAMPDYLGPMARRLGLKWIALPAEAEPIGGLDGAAVTRTLRGPHALYQLPPPLPRVVFATVARTEEPEALIANPLPADFGDPNVVYLPMSRDRPRSRDRPGARTNGGSESARVGIQTYENTRILMSVQTDQPGWVVLHDTWHPWWSATVDGRPAKVLRANGIFRAVRVEAGAHTIEMTFQPVRAALAEARHRLGLSVTTERAE